MLFALKRALGETESSFAAAGDDDAAVRTARRSWCSSSSTRRFRAAISERWVVDDFFSEKVSRRISLRATRAISSFRTDATFDMVGVGDRVGKRLRAQRDGTSSFQFDFSRRQAT